MTKKKPQAEMGKPNERAVPCAHSAFLLPSGFTLIELLIVITIIGILSAMILNTAGAIQKKGARARAQAEISSLSAALENYKQDMGDYPLSASNTNSGLGSTSLYGVLSPTNGKVYLEFKGGMTNTNGIVDPFGIPYGYQYPGSNNATNFFDLWSTAGGATNTNSWIQNW